jgi:hypothetical protein
MHKKFPSSTVFPLVGIRGRVHCFIYKKRGGGGAPGEAVIFSKAGTTSANRFWLGNINLNPADGSKMVVVSKVSVFYCGKIIDYFKNKNMCPDVPQPTSTKGYYGPVNVCFPNVGI